MKAKLNFRPSLKVGVACLLGLTLSVGAAYAVAPAAGTIIGNQASATYDLNGQTKTVLSNLVETRVDEVYAVDVTNLQTLAGTAGQTLYFPHTITNTGNATDTFNLTSALSGQVSGVVIYPDLDGNGVPDSCLVPKSYGVSLGQLKETNLWEVYCMLTPRQRLESEKRYKTLKRASLR